MTSSTADFNVGGAFNTLGSDFYRSRPAGNDVHYRQARRPLLGHEPNGIQHGRAAHRPLRYFLCHRPSDSTSPTSAGSLSGSKEWDLCQRGCSQPHASLGISHSSQILDDANVKTMNKQGDIKNNFDYDSFTSRLNLRRTAQPGLLLPGIGQPVLHLPLCTECRRRIQEPQRLRL